VLSKPKPPERGAFFERLNMFVEIINPALTDTDNIVFQSDVIDPDTQEVIFQKGNPVDFTNMMFLLSKGIDYIDVDNQV
jgi:hypothetical protein